MKRLFRYLYSCIRILIPLLYLVMYLPIWNGKHLILDLNLVIMSLFLFQCSALFHAILMMIYTVKRKEPSTDTFIISIIMTAISTVFLLFAGYVFCLNLLGLPIMPTPGHQIEMEII